MQVRYSKNGTPSFACSPTPHILVDRGVPANTPYIATVPPFGSTPAGFDQHEWQKVWWDDIARLGEQEYDKWQHIWRTMATNQCIVDVNFEPQASWAAGPGIEPAPTTQPKGPTVSPKPVTTRRPHTRSLPRRAAK